MNYSCPKWKMVIFLLVLPFLDPKCSMASMMSMPSFTFPKTTFSIQPLSLGSEGKKLGTICDWPSIFHGQDARIWMLKMKFSSSNFSPEMNLPQVPLWLVIWLPWCMIHGIILEQFLWKEEPLHPNLFSPVFCCLWTFVCKQFKEDMAQWLPWCKGT